MFYVMELEDYIRVEPELFGIETKEAIMKQLEKTYSSFFDKEIGAVVLVLEIDSIGEGIIIPGDGAVYYNTSFKVLTFKPELQELVYGVVDEITNFGALIDMGVIKGMLHISQAMDDYVNFSKSNVLTGKNSKRALKKGDVVLARIVAISFKGEEPKIGLTMRQPGLGKLEWIQEDKRKVQMAVKKAEKSEEKSEKKGKGKKK
jgi:DNA-directed RNA polymerase subunit E'